MIHLESELNQQESEGDLQNTWYFRLPKKPLGIKHPWSKVWKTFLLSKTLTDRKPTVLSHLTNSLQYKTRTMD